MSFSEIRTNVKYILKGKFSEALAVVTVCFVAGLFVVSAEAAVGLGFVLAGVKNLYAWAGLIVGGAVLETFVLIPPVTGGFWWFSNTTGKSEFFSENITKLYASFKLNFRAFWLYLLMRIICIASLLPAAGLLWTCREVFLRYGSTPDGVFFCLQFLILALLSLGLLPHTVLGLIPAPFIFVRTPEKNPFSIVFKSMKIMRPQRFKALGLVLSYAPWCLPVVTIPIAAVKCMFAFAILSDPA
jgi:uncharacterized membrane protein